MLIITYHCRPLVPIENLMMMMMMSTTTLGSDGLDLSHLVVDLNLPLRGSQEEPSHWTIVWQPTLTQHLKMTHTRGQGEPRWRAQMLQ